MIRKLPNIVVTALALALVTGFSRCKQSSSSNAPQTATDTSTPASAKKPTPRSTFEQDLQYIRNSQYTHIWVFARRDGKPFDKEDGDYLHQTAPHVLDWVGTDEGKRYIAGSNFDLDPGTWKLLRKRFLVEDYSGK